ncbi:hypothetical protein [Devosia naphthalenivorans]|uniref:hypothetical protein n=1 Tax=Devosia naphthalenivorans TaxID=2082392 RepID=UPI000D35E7CF|nr:hypothetical protein [Devosia naphthalenivorans]
MIGAVAQLAELKAAGAESAQKSAERFHAMGFRGRKYRRELKGGTEQLALAVQDVAFSNGFDQATADEVILFVVDVFFRRLSTLEGSR